MLTSARRHVLTEKPPQLVRLLRFQRGVDLECLPPVASRRRRPGADREDVTYTLVCGGFLEEGVGSPRSCQSASILGQGRGILSTVFVQSAAG